MIILRARALSNGKYEVSDHLGNTKRVNEEELKIVIRSGAAIIIGVELNGRNQVKEKKISDAEEALWKIYVSVKLFDGNYSDDDDYYDDMVYFYEEVDAVVNDYFSIRKHFD